LTRLSKLLLILSIDTPEEASLHFDEILCAHSWEYLEVLTFYTKPLDESNPKLRDITLKVLRNFYSNEDFDGLRDRLDRIRFTEVISFKKDSFSDSTMDKKKKPKKAVLLPKFQPEPVNTSPFKRTGKAEIV